MCFLHITPQQWKFELLGLSDKPIRYITSNDENHILFFNGIAMMVDQFNASLATDPFATGSGINPKEAEARFKEGVKEMFDERIDIRCGPISPLRSTFQTRYA